MPFHDSSIDATDTPVPGEAGIFASSEGDVKGNSSEYLSGSQGDRVIAALDAPWVRDLAWLLTSPNLLSHHAFPGRLADPTDAAVFGPDAAVDLLALLTKLNTTSAVAAQALAAHQERRLGRYAERLLALWLTSLEAGGGGAGVSITALGLPVRDGGRTLGECDALFKTLRSNEHWELAVKFYLHIDNDGAKGADSRSSAPDCDSGCRAPDLRDCAAYVGAGLADRLDLKLRRLIDHQMPLSSHPALLALAPGPWNARMFVKGRLFYPIERWRTPLRAVPHDAYAPSAPTAHVAVAALATDHARGWWATFDTWRAWAATVSCRWTALARLDWLASLRVDGSRALQTQAFIDGLDPQGSDLTHPIQVAALTAGPADSPAVEISRGFIVPNDWPLRAQRYQQSGV